MIFLDDLFDWQAQQEQAFSPIHKEESVLNLYSRLGNCITFYSKHHPSAQIQYLNEKEYKEILTPFSV